MAKEIKGKEKGRSSLYEEGKRVKSELASPWLAADEGREAKTSPRPKTRARKGKTKSKGNGVINSPWQRSS
jgi:hypothetical protein